PLDRALKQRGERKSDPGDLGRFAVPGTRPASAGPRQPLVGRDVVAALTCDAGQCLQALGSATLVREQSKAGLGLGQPTYRIGVIALQEGQLSGALPGPCEQRTLGDGPARSRWAVGTGLGRSG